jgi:hypothetical protein
MPDPIRLLQAMGASAAVACLVWLLLAFPWKTSAPARKKLGWIWGTAIGSIVGFWFLDFRPAWPPREDQDRFLFLVFPAAVLIESIVAVVRWPRWLRWLLRFGFAAIPARLLLQDSIYLSDVGGAGTRKWTESQAIMALSAMAIFLALVWAALALLQKLTVSRSIPLALSMTLSTAGVAVMLTGYITGGELGLLICAALVGAVVASCASPSIDVRGSSIGIGVIGLFSVLVVGRFFGSLSTQQALILFVAPLICWLPELPGIRRLRPWASGILRLILVATPLAFVLAQTQKEFAKEREEAPGQNQPTLQDYLNFGK